MGGGKASTKSSVFHDISLCLGSKLPEIGLGSKSPEIGLGSKLPEIGQKDVCYSPIPTNNKKRSLKSECSYRINFFFFVCFGNEKGIEKKLTPIQNERNEKQTNTY